MIKQRTRLARDDEPLSIDQEIPDAGPRFTKGQIAFVLAELALLISIPVLAVLGGRALLTSQAGEFVEAPGPDDPGWLAFVEPTPIALVTEVLDGSVTGAALVVRSGPDAAGGAVVLIPGNLEIEGRLLSERSVPDAANALAASLRLAIPAVIEGDAVWWEGVVGEGLALDNPDPVPVAGGVLQVGEIVVEPSAVPSYLGASLPGASPEALEFRRELWWRSLLEAELDGAGGGASLLGSLQQGTWRLATMPTLNDGSVRLDVPAVDRLVSELVPLPVGALPGDRVQLKLLDRTGDNDLTQISTELGRLGFEIAQIGNVDAFDGGPTQLVVPPGTPDEAVSVLTELTSAGTLLVNPEEEAVTVLTMLLGPGFEVADVTQPGQPSTDGDSTD